MGGAVNFIQQLCKNRTLDENDGKGKFPAPDKDCLCLPRNSLRQDVPVAIAIKEPGIQPDREAELLSAHNTLWEPVLPSVLIIRGSRRRCTCL